MAGLGSQELYRLVLDSLPVAVCALDREGKVILWNDGAERVTGYLRQDVPGHLCTDAFLEHADTDNNPLEGSALPLLETMRDGKCLTVRASLRKKCGQSVGVHVRTVPLRGDDGRMHCAAELFEEMIARTATDRRHDKLAAALVGTFLGILLCYGFLGPIAANMLKATEEEHAYYQVLRVIIVSFMKGSPPTISVEFGRRAIPGNVRPRFQETEKYIKDKGGDAPASPPAEKPA